MYLNVLKTSKLLLSTLYKNTYQSVYRNIGLKFKIQVTEKSTPYIQIILYDNSIWFGWRKP